MSNGPYISPEDFIDKWLEAVAYDKGTSWIAKELGSSPKRVRQRAAYLRDFGVVLPHLNASSMHRTYQSDRDRWNEKIKAFLEDFGEDRAYDSSNKRMERS